MLVKFATLVLLFLTVYPVLATEKQPLTDANTIVFGRAVKQSYLPNECDSCTHWYYRWTIAIEQHVSGPVLPHVIKAARLQHGEYIFAGKQTALYVLSKILDPKQRELLGCSYFIKEYSPPREFYCVDDKKNLGLSDEEAFASDGKFGCFEKSQLFNSD